VRGEKPLELGHEFWQHGREREFHDGVSFQRELEWDVSKNVYGFFD
jgi:hypothetical protein